MEESAGPVSAQSEEFTGATRLWLVASRWAALAIVGWLLGWYSIVPAFDRGSIRGMYLSAAVVISVAIAGLLVPVLRRLRPLCLFLIVGATMATTLFVDLSRNGLLPA